MNALRITTVNVPPCEDLGEVVARATQAADPGPGSEPGPDLVVLPETCRGEASGAELWPGRTVKALQEVAARHGTYVLFGIDHRDETGRYNSAVLLDRAGDVVGRYDKRFPYWPEFDLDPPIGPGSEPVVWRTDLGRVGVAVCFDINFPEVWADLARRDAEIVVWLSAYTGGRPLSGYAAVHHFHVLSCTHLGDSRLYNPLGRQVAPASGADSGAGADAGDCATFDLDRDTGYYHENFNLEPMEKLLAERSGDVELVEHLTSEQWLVLRASRPDVSARELAREYGLEELRDYVRRSRTFVTGSVAP